MDSPREVWAVWRALLLPSGKGANGPQGAESAVVQHPAAWRASPSFDAEEADLCARQRGLQLPHRGWFSGPRDEQADSLSENNVGTGPLFVIGLHGSGDAIAHFLRDWEVAKEALSQNKTRAIVSGEASG